MSAVRRVPGAGAAGVQEGGARAADGAAVPRRVPAHGLRRRLRQHVGAAGARAQRGRARAAPPRPHRPRRLVAPSAARRASTLLQRFRRSLSDTLVPTLSWPD